MNHFAGKASSTYTGLLEVKSADLDSVGWYKYNSINGTTGDSFPSYSETGYGTHRVGLKDPVSENLKIYDLSGNVSEWCWEWRG